MTQSLRKTAHRTRTRFTRLLQSKLALWLGKDKQVKYEGFTTSHKTLREFVAKQGIHPLKELALDWLMADKLLPQSFSLLDVGCGPGVLANIISQNPTWNARIQYTGLDQSESALDYCRSTYPQNYSFLNRDLQNQDVPDSFDVVIINEVVEHLPDYHDLIEKAIAKKPKIFIITTFGVVPELRRDRKYWNTKHQCYMNSYAFAPFLSFLRSKTNDIRVADLGTQNYDRQWFSHKSYLLFYLRLQEPKLVWTPDGWTRGS